MDGIILVNKEKGISSFEVVKRVRKILKIQKVGHAGTLDPQAEGLLIILLGKATKLFSCFSKFPKEYIFKVVFGKSTETGDIEGKIIEEKKCPFITQEVVDEVLPLFLGKIKQKPHQYSAVKISGVPAYYFARKGEKVDLPEKEVQIYQLKLLDFIPGNFPKAKILAVVSSGTYIRTLAEDIGKKLKVPAFCMEILRTKIGPFRLENSFYLSQIEKEKEKVIIDLQKIQKILDKN